MRRILATSSIGNQPHNLHGKYVPGSGVGATSVSTRRLKLYKSCIQQPIVVYIPVSNIATYDTDNNYWILNQSTVITPLQNLIIDEGQTLSIPFDYTLTNNGYIDNYGTILLTNNAYLDEDYGIASRGSTFYNTGKFNNYGEFNVYAYSAIYTYGGGSVFNSNYINANIFVDGGLFALPPLDINESTCGTGSFTGKPIDGYSQETNQGGIDYVCPS